MADPAPVKRQTTKKKNAHSKRKHTSAHASTAANFTRVYEYEEMFNSLRDSRSRLALVAAPAAEDEPTGLHYSLLRELMGLWDIPVTDDGFKVLMDDLELGRQDHGEPEEILFETVLQLLLKPQYELCLAVTEPMRTERRANIDKHIAALVGDDQEKREAALREPPTEIMGDRQACRMVALLLNDQTRCEEHRIFMMRALGVIAEKPRLLSGEQPPPSEKRKKVYDIKAMAGYMKVPPA